MLSVQTSAKNEAIQILKEGELIADLKYAPGTHYRLTATYGDNELLIKPLLNLGSLIGLHKFKVTKNNQLAGTMSMQYFGGIKISSKLGTVTKNYKVKRQGKDRCILVDNQNNTILRIHSEFNIRKLKREIKVEAINMPLEKAEQKTELLTLGVFCTQVLLTNRTIAD